jgi:hypothetical protein
MRALLGLLLMLVFVVAACDNDGPTGTGCEGGVEGITLLSTYEELSQVCGGKLREINFEQLPREASSCSHHYGPGERDSIPNPLNIYDVIFEDQNCLRTGFCSFPTRQRDTTTGSSGNITLFLNVDGVIKFPRSTSGVLLVIEGIGDHPFALEVTDNARNALTAGGQGTLFGVTQIGFASSRGLKTVKILRTDSAGPIVLTAVYVKSARFRN